MSGSLPILLLEDDEVDAMKFKRALKELSIPNPVARVENGEDGLAYLQTDAQPKPCLIFTDINMPRMNGLEFIRAVKENGGFKSIPIIVLTAAGEERDRRECLALGAAGFLLKPADYDAYVEMIRTMQQYWVFSRA